MHLSVLAVSVATLAATVMGASHNNRDQHRRHHEIAVREPGHMVEFEKRFDGCRFTFYDVGLGACGQYNVASDFIVALNTPQYGGGYPGPNCGKSITITANGKTTQATIMDQCPGCPYCGLDFSRGLFNFFASEDVGVLTGSWTFNDGSGGGTIGTTTKETPKPTTTKETPKPTTTWTPEPTTTWTPEPTTTWKPEPTTTWTPEPTTTWTPEPTTSSTKPHTSSAKPSSSSVEPSTSSTWSSSSSSSSSTHHSSSTSSAAPSSSAEPSKSASSSAAATPSASSGTLQDANQALLGLGYLACSGGQ